MQFERQGLQHTMDHIYRVTASEITIKNTIMPFTASKDTNDAILTLLQEMSKSNRDIVNRIDALERQQSASSTPVIGKHQARIYIDPNTVLAATASLEPQVSRTTNEGYVS